MVKPTPVRIVITHTEMGVYLGGFLGLGFWTLIDPAGQPSAVTFDDEAQARAHVSSWCEENDPDAYRYVPVTTCDYAAPAELKDVGLGHLLGDMEADALRYAEPEGNA